MPAKDLVSWNTMIHGFATCGDVGTARQLFDMSSERDLVSWSSMIAGYAKSRQSNEALILFHDMQSANVRPDRVTMVSVLFACGDLGALGMGKIVHEYIDRNKVEIAVKLGTSLVDMYAKYGDIENSLKVFNGMGVKDVLTWSAVIIGRANHGFGEHALDYLAKMISGGIKANDITFIGVLSACSHVGVVDRGWTYFTSMNDKYGVTPKIEHYGCMVDLLVEFGDTSRGKRALLEICPLLPDAIVWRTFISACKIHKNMELVEEATVNLLELEPHMDGNYVLLSNMYAQGKKWDDVVNVRRRMRDKTFIRFRE
ncbi:hypothetical protein IFM89_023868 [Coptis chinensis]|uniref:Pentatricopeptide repeat-containing protein n=1 Tax=Coptis chinensis TaxID=261450 RepID=A0A835H2D0_9MAGN|nr:hypothetical protein IFM89_023868 [Coptis chinensis]